MRSPSVGEASPSWRPAWPTACHPGRTGGTCSAPVRAPPTGRRSKRRSAASDPARWPGWARCSVWCCRWPSGGPSPGSPTPTVEVSARPCTRRCSTRSPRCWGRSNCPSRTRPTIPGYASETARLLRDLVGDEVARDTAGARARSRRRALVRKAKQLQRAIDEADEVEQRLDRGAESLVREFDQVLGVLRDWGYVRGWDLTERGRSAHRAVPRVRPPRGRGAGPRPARRPRRSGPGRRALGGRLRAPGGRGATRSRGTRPAGSVSAPPGWP